MTPPIRSNFTQWFPAKLLGDHLALALLLWAGLLTMMLLLTLVVSIWRPIEISGWDVGAGAIPWYVLFIGHHLGWSTLALHIAHGQTRRSFMAKMLVFIPAFTAATAAMTTAGFAIEGILYGLHDWPQVIGPGRLFASAHDFTSIFLQSWLTQALGGSCGFLIAVAWYRSTGLGVAVVLVAVLAGNFIYGSDWGPLGLFHEQLLGAGTRSDIISAAIHLGSIVLVLATAWLLMRDMPLRSKRV